MTEEVNWICQRMDGRICPDGTKWYLFGSALRAGRCSSDIDILVVYSSIDHPSLIRERIKELELQRPMHVLFMTEKEERELDFIASENAVEIYPTRSGELGQAGAAEGQLA